MNPTHKKIAEAIKHNWSKVGKYINPDLIIDIANILEEEDKEFRICEEEETEPFNKTQFLKTAGCNE